jgi:hypothetical protein
MSIVKVLGISLLLAIPLLGTVCAMEKEGKEVGATYQDLKNVNAGEENQQKQLEILLRGKRALIEGPVRKNENAESVRYTARIQDNGLVEASQYICYNCLKDEYYENISGFYTRKPNPTTDHDNPPIIELLSPQDEKELFYNLQEAFAKQEQSK